MEHSHTDSLVKQGQERLPRPGVLEAYSELLHGIPISRMFQIFPGIPQC